MNSQSKEPELKVDNRSKEKDSDESVLTSSFFNFLIILTIIGAGLIIRTLTQSRQALLDIKPSNYKFPSFEDFHISLFCAVIIMVLKYLNYDLK
jgi:hypothetical protein